MTSDDLVTIFKESDLTLYEVAKAIDEAFYWYMENTFSYQSIEDMTKYKDLMAFYFAAVNYGRP